MTGDPRASSGTRTALAIGSARRPDAIVIGAGPYGLATTSYLLGAGLSVRVFGEPMESWRGRMPRGMYLKSTPAASNIAAPSRGSTLADFLTATGAPPLPGHNPVPIESFIRYGLWFQDRHVPNVDTSRVVNVTSDKSGYVVSLDSGEELATSTVVIASGLNGTAWMPSELAHRAACSELISHASQHSDFDGFAGRRVAVIGAGQSALESAALLYESGADVEIFVRGSRVLFAKRPADIDRRGPGTPLKPETPLGPGWSHFAFSRMPGAFRRLPSDLRLRFVATVLGPSGAWWLRERVDGRIKIHLRHHLESVERDNDRVTLSFVTEHGTRRTPAFDHVLAGTGYRVDIDQLEWMDSGLKARIERTNGNWPRLGRGFEASAPGLYFVGLAAAASFGPLMRFVCGTGFAARRVSQSVAQRRSGT